MKNKDIDLSGFPDMNKELKGTIIAVCSSAVIGRPPIATTTTVGEITLPDGRRAQVTITVNTDESDWD